VIATQAQAQIIYTDVIPDQIYNSVNDTCLIDLDDDGQLDLRIRYVQDIVGLSCMQCTGQLAYPRHIYVDPMPGNQIADSAIAYVKELSSGDAIDGSLLWGADAGQLLVEKVGASCTVWIGGSICAAIYANGDWGLAPPATGFVGVQFLIGGQVHYGWVRLRVQSGPGGTMNLYLLDYAYNSVPGEPILAGESLPTSIARIAQSSMQVSPNPCTSTLIVSLGMERSGVATCTVRALTGQALLTRTVAATSGPSTIILDLASLAPGTYLLEMQTGGERIVRKVVKE
jgi:hypothetical protein